MIKNKRLKMLTNEADHHQHFSIRKLSIGAASVLLGTSLYLGMSNGQVQAAENSAENTESQTSLSRKIETTKNSDVSQLEDKNTKDSQKLENPNTGAVKSSENPSTSNGNKVTPSKSNPNKQNADKKKLDQAIIDSLKTKLIQRSNTNEEKPYFSGSVYIKNADGSDVPAFNTADGIEIHSGDQYLLKYQLSTQGGNPDTTNTKFIVLIPEGFNTNGLENDGSANGNPYSIQSLGKTKNGELIYQVTTNKAPDSANGQVDLKALITASNSDDPAIYGKHTYNLWNQLVFGEADTVISNPQFGPGYGGGNTDIELENGTKITASKNIFGVEGQQNGQINYTLMPANAHEVNIDNSGIDINYSVTANSQPVQGKLGQEDLNVTLNFPNHNISDNQKIKDGDYIDFKLGIPYKDEQGNTKVLPYDTILANPDGFPNDGQLKTQSGTTIGQIYNMGTYYRVIFNSNTGNFYSNNVDEASLTISFSLPWQNADFSSQSIASVCWPYTYYLYQYTNDKSKDGTGFMKQLSDDVNINGKTYASGLNIRGKYIYRGYFAQKNTQNVESISSDKVRNWNSQTNAVNVNTEWQNTNNIRLALKGADNDQNVGYNFKIVTQVGKSPLINYQWKTDEEVAQEIKQIISTPKKTNLKNQVLNTNDFVSFTQTDGTKPTAEITVTHVDQNTNNQLKRIYHVVISNPDVVLNGPISTLTASASGFTLPDYIKNYNDELAKVVTQGNYSGDDTANHELLNALINTERVNSQVIDQSGKNISLNNQGTKWTAQAFFSPTGSSANGYFSVHDLAKAHLKFIDEATNEQVGEALSTEGGIGYRIAFPAFDTVLQNLRNEGYELDYIENQDNEHITQDKLGNFGINNSKFTAYLKKSNRTSSYKVHYIDVTGKTLPTGQTQWQQTDGTELTNHTILVSGYVGAISSAQLWNYAAAGYSLVQAPNDLGTQVFTKNTPDQYVYIKANKDIPTPPVTEKGSYKIYYIDLGANPSKTTDLKPEDGHEISAHTITVKGKIGDKPVVTLWDYTKDHYLKVSEPDNLANVAIGKGMANQYVYLKHQTTDISNQKTITETIKYQYADGSKASNDSTASFTFTENGYHDLVTDQTNVSWTPTTHQFTEVEIPKIDNYEVTSATLNDAAHTSYLSSDKKYVNAINVDPTSTNPVITVIFARIPNKDNQPVLVSDTKTVTETIKYKYEDGTKVANDYQKTITFTRNGQKLHGNITWGSWIPVSDQFPDITSPIIEGYTPDRSVVIGKIVTADSQNIEVTVIYSKNEPAEQKPQKPVTPTTPSSNNQVPTQTNTNSPKSTTNTEELTQTIKPRSIKEQASNSNFEKTNKILKSDKGDRAQLPQTGSKQNQVGYIGLAISSLSALFGFGLGKKKNN